MCVLLNGFIEEFVDCRSKSNWFSEHSSTFFTCVYWNCEFVQMHIKLIRKFFDKNYDNLVQITIIMVTSYWISSNQNIQHRYTVQDKNVQWISVITINKTNWI